jgi:4-alpha-glucanotransferase
MGDMTELAPSLVELARRFGIATEYDDWTGRRVLAPEDTLVAVLAALGVAAGTEQERNVALTAQRRSYWERPMPATIVGRTGEQIRFWVHVTHGDSAEVWLQLEDGTVRGAVQQVDNFTQPFDLDGRWIGEASFVLPAHLPLGYHRVHLRSGDSETSTALIVTPDWLGLPEQLGARRAWGLAAQLYSVRSRQSWGVGDLTDLSDLAVWSASRHGADYVLVNPLHAAAPSGPASPMEPSPYLPTSRRFFNPLYLRVEAIPEYAELTKRGCARTSNSGPANSTPSTATARGRPSAPRSGCCIGCRGRRVVSWPTPRSATARAARSTTSPPGARWPKNTAAIGIAGRSRCSIPARPVSRASSNGIRIPSISTAGCSGNSTSNSPRRNRRRYGPGWRWASCTTWPSGCTPTAPTPGPCRM